LERSFEHVVEIEASADDVWRALADFPAYAEWNPFMRRVTGRPAVGSRLQIELEPEAGRRLTVTPHVVTADPGAELRWQGRLAVPGLFGGEHAFLIEPGAGRSVRLVHRGWYRGLLVRAFGRTIDRTAHGFERMEVALKALVEARRATEPAQAATMAGHDDALQTLVAVGLALDRLALALAEGDRELALELGAAARRMLAGARRRAGPASAERWPPLLEREGLGAALGPLVARLAPGPAPTARVVATGARWHPAAEQIAHDVLGRVVAMLAADPRAGRITVTVTDAGGDLEATVYCDVDVPVDLARAARLVRIAGGELRAAAGDPEGTRVRLTLPG
jgi:hypothetical protein